MGLMPPPDAAALRAAFACIPQGVAAVCAIGADLNPRGLAASSLTTVSLEPPLMSVCMARSSRTWSQLRGLDRIGLSVLSHTQNDACRALAAREGDRFAAVDWHRNEQGAVFLDEAVLWVDCSIEDELPAGDHHMVLLRIHGIEAGPGREPLVFHASGFHRLQRL